MPYDSAVSVSSYFVSYISIQLMEAKAVVHAQPLQLALPVGGGHSQHAP